VATNNWSVPSSWASLEGLNSSEEKGLGFHDPVTRGSTPRSRLGLPNLHHSALAKFLYYTLWFNITYVWTCIINVPSCISVSELAICCKFRNCFPALLVHELFEHLLFIHSFIHSIHLFLLYCTGMSERFRKWGVQICMNLIQSCS